MRGTWSARISDTERCYYCCCCRCYCCCCWRPLRCAPLYRSAAAHTRGLALYGPDTRVRLRVGLWLVAAAAAAAGLEFVWWGKGIKKKSLTIPNVNGSNCFRINRLRCMHPFRFAMADNESKMTRRNVRLSIACRAEGTVYADGANIHPAFGSLRVPVSIYRKRMIYIDRITCFKCIDRHRFPINRNI